MTPNVPAAVSIGLSAAAFAHIFGVFLVKVLLMWTGSENTL